MALPYYTVDQAEQIAKKYAKDAPSGEPAAYIKNAATSADGHTLTLTKKDDTSVTFMPGAYAPFPTEFVTNSTTYAFAQSVLAHSTFKAGMVWQGELLCTDLPEGLVNVECRVTAMTNAIAVIELFSSNRAPYHWEYNTDSYTQTSHDGWKLVMTIREAELTGLGAGTFTLKMTKSAGLQDIRFHFVKDT